jgi:transcriptional regulator with XRE-family HTH domain
MQSSSFGELLKRWRTARRYTQEALAFDAEVSTRHLSFLEGGKAAPSRQMVLVLASALDLPLRDRNTLLLAAGYAPVYRVSPLDDAGHIRHALERIVRQQEPYPAVVYDRGGDLVLMNTPAQTWLPLLLEDPNDDRARRNVHHALFSPAGMRNFVIDWEKAAGFLIARLRREIAAAPDDDVLLKLHDELLAYPDVKTSLAKFDGTADAGPFLPIHVKRGDVELKLFSTLTTLGTPLDVTAQELTIESFFPADDATERMLRSVAV